MNVDYKEKILTFIKKSNSPVDVEKIRKHCGIGNWVTALNGCLQLFIQGKIKGRKTSKSWVFWIHEPAQLKPWEEVIGYLDAFEVKEESLTLTLITRKKLNLTFPKNSIEAQTLMQTLERVPKGTKIALLKTDEQVLVNFPENDENKPRNFTKMLNNGKVSKIRQKEQAPKTNPSPDRLWSIFGSFSAL